MSCNMKLKMLFNLETGNKKNTRAILNLYMAIQLKLFVFDRIASFYDTLTMEQEDASSIHSLTK